MMQGRPTIAAIGIAVLPIAEIVLRRFFSTGIEGSAPITSHLTLVVGLIGAAIAARDGKLLSLATGTLIPEGIFRQIAQIAADIKAGGRIPQAVNEVLETLV